ncbi:hypothetical protein RUM44_008746 [Polyplax serrata]|uniref:Uncharacterized protein n=1 Tax=Polyplax serrata TaxID=468196 RepID=A0ABR1BD57_POLSC
MEKDTETDRGGSDVESSGNYLGAKGSGRSPGRICQIRRSNKGEDKDYSPPPTPPPASLPDAFNSFLN